MRINPDCPECNGRGYVELFLSSSPCHKCGPHAVTREVVSPEMKRQILDIYPADVKLLSNPCVIDIEPPAQATPEIVEKEQRFAEEMVRAGSISVGLSRHLEIESTLMQALHHSAAGVPVRPSMASKLASLAGQVLYGEGFTDIDVEAYTVDHGYRVRASCEGHTFKLFIKPPTEEQVRAMMIDKIAAQHPELGGNISWATRGPGGKSRVRKGTRAEYRRHLSTLTTHKLRSLMPVEPRS